MALAVEPLSRAHDRSGFRSGEPALDRYLAEQAMQDRRRLAAAAYVLVEAAQPAILGYYTLSSAMVLLSVLADGVARRLPRYPEVPATRVGRLAVDERQRGRGLGGTLLMDAVRRCRAHANEIGSALVIVDAKNEAAVGFYRHFGFHAFRDRPMQLFLAMSEIERMP